nr:MAG TPA: hypothetical protein [Caudoviricetes sp.]
MAIIQCASINGDTIQQSIISACAYAKKEYTGFKSIIKYGFFNRKREHARTVSDFDITYTHSFAFQTYLSICDDVTAIEKLRDVCVSLGMTEAAQQCEDEINCRDKDFDMDGRRYGLSVYLAWLQWTGHRDVPHVKVDTANHGFKVYARDVAKLLTGGSV